MSEVVVITGASAGVGRATVRAFAKRRASVVLIARDTKGLLAAAEEVNAAGGRALPVAIDVADSDAVESAAERVERQFGPIDIWINVGSRPDPCQPRRRLGVPGDLSVQATYRRRVGSVASGAGIDFYPVTGRADALSLKKSNGARISPARGLLSRRGRNAQEYQRW